MACHKRMKLSVPKDRIGTQHKGLRLYAAYWLPHFKHVPVALESVIVLMKYIVYIQSAKIKCII